MPTGAEHNCQDFQGQIQRELDTPPSSPSPVGRVSNPSAAPGRVGNPSYQEGTGGRGSGPESCPACRELYAAAGLLRRGLGLLAPPPVPAGLAARIVGRVLAD